MDKNVYWGQINSMFQSLSAEEERMEGKDLEHPLSLLYYMIKSYPSLVARVEGLEESKEVEHRIQAFSSFIMCKTFNFQARLKYQNIEQEIFNLQKIVLDTLLQNHREQWKRYMSQVINFTFRLVLSQGRNFQLFRELLKNKELELLARQERTGYCRILADLDPEDSLFPNTDRLVPCTAVNKKGASVSKDCEEKTKSTLYLISCCNRIILNYIQDILEDFKNSESTLRKLSLVQTCLPDSNLSLQYLAMLSHLNTYKNEHFQSSVVLELHVVHELFSQVYSAKFDQEWKHKFENVLYEYFDKRTSNSVPVSIVEAYRSKLLHLLTSFITKRHFKNLAVEKKQKLLRFLNNFLSGKDCDDEFYREFVRSSLELGQDTVLFDQTFTQIKGPTKIQSRYKSEKKKSVDGGDSDLLKDELSLDQSRVWCLVTHQVTSSLNEAATNPASILAVLDTYLSSAVRLTAKSVQSWPQVAVKAFDSKLLAKIISILCSFAKSKQGTVGASKLYEVIKNIITLTYEDPEQEYRQQLEWLAGLLGHSYLEVMDTRQSDLKLGKFAQELVHLSQLTDRSIIQSNDPETLLLLSKLGRDICPKWRTAVIKTVITNNPKSVVRCLPYLISNVGGSTAYLAKELIQSLDRTNNQDFSGEVGLYSGILVCCLAKTVKVIVSPGEDGSADLMYTCTKCNQSEATADNRRHHRGSTVEFEDIQPLFKLIGHHDQAVRSGLLEMVTPLCFHSCLTNSAALLLLTYVHDPNSEIRNKFSKLISNLLECGCSTLEGRDQVSVSIVDSLLQMSPVGKSEDEWESYVCTLVTAHQSILPQQCQTKILEFFLGLFFNPKRHELSKKYCFTILQDALLKEKNEILHWCARLMCSSSGDKSQPSDNHVSPEQVIQYLNQLVPGEEVETFLLANLHHILPILFQQSALHGLKKPIQVIASFKGVRPKALIHEYFTKIYAYIVVNCDDKQFDLCMKHLKRETAIDLVDFLNCHRLKSIEELLCVFSCNRDKVIKALRTCASVDENFRNKVSGEMDVKKVKQYLSYNNNLMATLSFFLVTLSHTSTTETKLNIVASLSELCKFLGPQFLAPVKHALLACLKTVNNLTRKCPALRSSCVTLWDAFVKNIDLNDIQVILPQVVVGLSSFIVMDKERVLPLYRYLLVTNMNKFKEIKMIMVLLPDTQELKDIQQQVCGSNIQFKTLLESIIHYIDHEAVEVRQQTLNMLKSLLESNMGALQGLLLRSDQTDEVVTHLVDKLMVCMSSRETDEAVRYVASECIGRIGAVDPGKLELEGEGSNLALNSKADRDYMLDITSVQFCVRLLQELVKASQSSRESNHHNICMFSLQSIAKIYQINTKHRNTFAERVLQELSDSHREIVYPVMNSNYAHQPTAQPEITIPVYGSSNGQNYKSWLLNFSQYLIQQVYDSKVKDIFLSCVPVMKKDASIAEFLLPHLVTAVVSAGGEEGINTVLLEVNSVLSDADSTDELREERTVEGNCDMLVAQTLFSVLDHANAWLQVKYSHLLAALGKPESQIRAEELQRAGRDKHYAAVKTFLTRISNESLANLSFNSGAYHRAAFYLDQTLNLQDLTDPQLNALQKLYAGLQEPDLVVGVAALRSGEPSLDSQILYNTAIGNYQDALCCFERQGDTDPVSLVQCYLNIDQPGLAARLAAGMAARDSSLERDLAPLRAEAAWQLGEWQLLEDFTVQHQQSQQLVVEDSCSADSSSSSCQSWEMGLSLAILAAHKDDRELFFQEVEKTRVLVLKTISAVSFEQGAYRKTYPQIGRLAMLREVESIADKILLVKPGEKSEVLQSRLTGLLEELDARLNYAQVSWSNLEPMLRLRRGMFGAAVSRFSADPKFSGQLSCEIGECWLKSAQIARKAGQLQESYSYLLEAEKYHNPKLYLEAARLKWKRNKRTEAISALKKGLVGTFPDVMDALENDQGSLTAALESLDNQSVGLRDLCAQGKLLLARYVEEAASVGQEGIKKYYDHTKDIVKNSDEVFYYLAKFLDKSIIKMSPDQIVNQSEIVAQAATTYFRSIRYGPTFLDECMPRLLTIWLDFAATVQELRCSKNKDSQQLAVLDHATNQLIRLNKFINTYRLKIPAYYYLTSFPQIVSRICHANNETYPTLKSLIVQVFLEFPQQAAWHMVSVSKNRDTTRKTRCKEVFQEVIQQKPSLKTFLTDAITFSQKIDDLCDANTSDRVVESSFKELLPSLPAMFQSREMSSIILPIERNMLVNIPTSLADIDTHNPFPSGCVTIQSVEDRIQVMVSLVKPKKVTFRGSDGKLYSFLAKPKDDLRRDCRLMDMGCMLNRMFRKEPETRKRGLKMRTYMVVPTNETSGLIEWVNNLKGMRQILIHLLKERGVSLSVIQKRNQPKSDDNSARKKEQFVRCLEEMKGSNGQSPSVFREWFIKTFPDPQAWFAARLAFTRTTAVMSMIGYILGLGDRHLENINVDTSTGDTFHVDMNSLFNVSENYKVPEIVPFRLTHNQVDGFGPLGVEGTYRKSCEVSLQMMRDQKDLLMSVLRPFIFDPLVDWTIRDKSKRKSSLGGEEANKPGQEALARVQDRLDGLINSGKKRKGHLHTPLSVEGQVDHVIREARSIDNLALMYWGWAPFL